MSKNLHEKAIRAEYEGLIEAIRKHDQLYYGENSPIVSDAEYDALHIRLQEIETENPWLKHALSPSQVVPSALSAFPKAKHTFPLLSLDKAHHEKDFKLFWQKCQKQSAHPEALIVQPKIDGLAISLEYIHGQLAKGKTRGDGKIGEDLTDNIQQIKGIPEKLTTPTSCDIRGEVYIRKEDFIELNKKQKRLGLQEFVNTRNAASGSLRQSNKAVTKERPLCFIAYSSYGIDHNTEEECLQWLKKQSFQIPEHSVSDSMSELLAIYERFCNHRHQYAMDIDGVVYKVNNKTLQRAMGHTEHHPRWAIAYKFPAYSGTSKLCSIDVQVGKTGALTPIAHLNPVTIGGVTITKASLHNFSFIHNKNLHINDIVTISRAGDVIPYVEGISTKGANRTPYVMPSHCPSCTTLLPTDNTKVLFCHNQTCPAQIYQKLVHFCSKSGLNIQALGPKNIAFLQDRKYVKSMADILRLPQQKNLYAELIKASNWGERSISKLLQSIQSASITTMSQLMAALAIPSIGPIAADSVSALYPTIPDLLNAFKENASFEEMLTQKIGQSAAGKLVAFLSHQANQDHLMELHYLITYKTSVHQGLVYTFTFTGTLSITRDEAIRIIQTNGHKYSPTLSKKTSFLVCGLSGGNKISKAEKYGINCISEEDFLSYVKSSVQTP